MKQHKLGYIYLFNTVFLFSTYEVVSKTLVGKIDPFQVNFIRFFIGGLLLFLFLLWKGEVAVSKKDLLLLGLVGIINVVASMNLLQMSLYVQGAKASVAAVIFSSNPIFVFAFSALLDKEKLHAHKLLGLLLGILGILVVFLEKLDFRTLDIKSPLLALLSAVFYGLYTVIGRKASVRVGSLKMNSYSFLIGSLCLLPFLLLFKIPVISFDTSGIVQLAYLAVMVTGLAYLTYFMGLSIMGASKGSLVFFIKPALASVLAILFLKERASLNLFFGTMLILLGIVSILYGKELMLKIRGYLAGFSNKM
jgi:drug/metabolite transporter (DMT)-like permease